MQITQFYGIDVSKETLDICLLIDNKLVEQWKIKNNKTSIRVFLRKLASKFPDHLAQYSVWCMEFTGVYGHILIQLLVEAGFNVWVENPSQIKLSQGIKRGKNDKIDALRIAQYASTFSHKFRAYVPKRSVLIQLKKLTNIRAKLQQTKVAIQKQIKEAKQFLGKETSSLLTNSCRKSLKALVVDIELIENKMYDLIQSDPKLLNLFKIITSVDGVGVHTAIAILVTTNEFESFDCPKKYACYAGVAPFEQQSGTSVKSKARVSQKANKEVKKLLHMAALTVLKIPGSEFAQYYHRKKEEGKNGMTIINAIRAKIISRVFACVREQRYYEKSYNYPVQQRFLSS